MNKYLCLWSRCCDFELFANIKYLLVEFVSLASPHSIYFFNHRTLCDFCNCILKNVNSLAKIDRQNWHIKMILFFKYIFHWLENLYHHRREHKKHTLSHTYTITHAHIYNMCSYIYARPNGMIVGSTMCLQSIFNKNIYLRDFFIWRRRRRRRYALV